VSSPQTPSPREDRRLKRLEVGRLQILDVAEDLFAENGYQGTSLEQIAAATEYSIGGIYKLFASKEDIFNAVMNRRGAELRTRLDAGIDESLSGEDKLLLVVSTFVRCFREWPSFGRLSARVFSMHLEGFPAVTGQAEALGFVMNLFAAAIEQGQREGTFRAGNPARLAYLIPGIINAQNQVDPVLANDPDGITLEDLLEIVKGALKRPAN
jgi:AcrR family transcriptional regulator